MQGWPRTAGPALLALVLLAGSGTTRADSDATPLQMPVFTQQERAWIAAHPVVNIAVDPYLQPLEYIENGKHQGLTADYMAAVAKASGLRFVVVPVAPDQVAAALAAGRVDVLPAVSPDFSAPDILGQLVVGTPYFVGGTVIVTRGYGQIIFDPHKLDGKIVALNGGGMYEQTLHRQYPAIVMRIVETPADALAAVAAGEADAAIGVDSVLLPILYSRYRDQLHVSGTIAEVPAVMSIGVRRQLPALASIIEKSLGTLDARQTDIIVARWMAHNNYGPPSWTQILRHRWRESLLIVAALLLLLFAMLRARRAKRAAEKSEQDKARFLAVMSHEIRTPMNAILASMELLGRSKLTQQQRQLSDLAGNASEALLELLDDVLDFSKLEASRVVLSKVPTDIRQLARGVVDIAELQAREKNLAIALHIDVPAATCLLLDPARIRQILINLTSNAVKFTERGLVQIRITLAFDAASNISAIPSTTTAGATLLLAVSDTGIGVAADRQQALFRPYHQAHQTHAAPQTSTRRFGGTGLGLAICRELCELMGGNIQFVSKQGVGSTVSCRIPVELAPATGTDANAGEIDQAALLKTDQPAPRQTARAALLQPAAPVDAPHILAVEDHPGNRMVLQRQLTQLGYRFTIVNDGLSALEQTAHNTFALMLLDCYLPDIDGYTVASRQRAREAGASHLPIIAISAAVDQAHLDACMRSGMDGTLRKPLRLAALETLLHGWCGPGKAHSDDTAAFTESAAEPAIESDTAALFMRITREDLADLERAVEQRAHDTAARAAHRIHGAALVCGWQHIATPAAVIEQEYKGKPDADRIKTALTALHMALKMTTAQLSENQ